MRVWIIFWPLWFVVASTLFFGLGLLFIPRDTPLEEEDRAALEKEKVAAIDDATDEIGDDVRQAVQIVETEELAEAEVERVLEEVAEEALFEVIQEGLPLSDEAALEATVGQVVQDELDDSLLGVQAPSVEDQLEAALAHQLSETFLEVDSRLAEQTSRSFGSAAAEVASNALSASLDGVVKADAALDDEEQLTPIVQAAVGDQVAAAILPPDVDTDELKASLTTDVIGALGEFEPTAIAGDAAGQIDLASVPEAEKKKIADKSVDVLVRAIAAEVVDDLVEGQVSLDREEEVKALVDRGVDDVIDSRLEDANLPQLKNSLQTLMTQEILSEPAPLAAAQGLLKALIKGGATIWRILGFSVSGAGGSAAVGILASWFILPLVTPLRLSVGGISSPAGSNRVTIQNTRQGNASATLKLAYAGTASAILEEVRSECVGRQFRLDGRIGRGETLRTRRLGPAPTEPAQRYRSERLPIVLAPGDEMLVKIDSVGEVRRKWPGLCGGKNPSLADIASDLARVSVVRVRVHGRLFRSTFRI